MKRYAAYSPSRVGLVVAAVAFSAAVAGCQYPFGPTASTATPAVVPSTSSGPVESDLAPGSPPRDSASGTAVSSSAALPRTGEGGGSGAGGSSDPAATSRDAAGLAAPNPAAKRPAPTISPPSALPAVQARPEYGRMDVSAEARTVTTRFQTFLSRVHQAKMELSADKTALTDLSQGPAREEVEAGLVEMEQQEYRQRGAVAIRSLSVFQDEAQGKRLVVACLDDSAVEIVASNGYVVRRAVQTPRTALNLYTMERVEGTWRVVKHAMPAAADCRVS